MLDDSMGMLDLIDDTPTARPCACTVVRQLDARLALCACVQCGKLWTTNVPAEDDA